MSVEHWQLRLTGIVSCANASRLFPKTWPPMPMSINCILKLTENFNVYELNQDHSTAALCHLPVAGILMNSSYQHAVSV